MKEPYGEGRADHSVPESCADGSRDLQRSVDRGTRRPAIELRNQRFRVPTLLSEAEGNIEQGGPSESFSNPAQSKTLCMRGTSTPGNREIPGTPNGRWSPRVGRRRPKGRGPGSPRGMAEL